MKKIIMLVAATMLACAMQAASVSWSTAIAGQGAAWSGNGAFVLAFDGADYDAVTALVTKNGSTTLQADLAEYALAASATFKDNRGNASATGRIDGSPDTVFWMVFSDGSYDAKSAVTWTAATDVTGNFYEPPASGTALTLTSASFANSGTIAAVSGGGGSGDVPEPTSGILLVVGGALLALRRKQK